VKRIGDDIDSRCHKHQVKQGMVVREDNDTYIILFPLAGCMLQFKRSLPMGKESDLLKHVYLTSPTTL
jgi:hypothetical protein